MAELSQSAYSKKLGLICPACGKGDTKTVDRPVLEEDGIVSLSCFCSKCNAMWTDEYRIKGYRKLIGGLEPKRRKRG